MNESNHDRPSVSERVILLALFNLSVACLVLTWQRFTPSNKPGTWLNYPIIKSSSSHVTSWSRRRSDQPLSLGVEDFGLLENKFWEFGMIWTVSRQVAKRAWSISYISTPTSPRTGHVRVSHSKGGHTCSSSRPEASETGFGQIMTDLPRVNKFFFCRIQEPFLAL